MDYNITWWNMPVGLQIANVGSEVSRAIRRKKKNDMQGTREFCMHAIEMLGYCKLDPKNQNRRNELSFAQEELMDYLLGDNLYQNNDESIMKWYDAFL